MLLLFFDPAASVPSNIASRLNRNILRLIEWRLLDASYGVLLLNPFANSISLLVVAVLVTLPLQFPTAGPSWLAPAALAVAFVALILRAVANRFRFETPVDIPLFIIIAILPINLWASPDFDGSMLRTYSFLGTLFVFWAIAAQHSQPKLLEAAPWLFLLAGLGLAFVIVIWTPFTFPGARAMQSRLFANVPLAGGTPWGTQLNTNLSAGVIVMFWAPALAVVLFGRNLLQRLLALPLVFIIPVILILAQSRGALTGIAVGFAVMAALVLRKYPVVIGLGALVAAVGVFLLDLPTRLQASSAQAATSVGNSLESRLELWSRAQYMLQDFPFSGVGPGRVQPTVHILYPLFRIAPDSEFSHYHNLFLQTGAESGLPALVAYIAFFVIVGVVLMRVVLGETQQHSVMALGLLGALITFLAHNMVDAVTFFPRAAFVIWSIFGYMMAVALAQRSGARPAVAPSST